MSSAVSAELILGLILLDPHHSDEWSLAYASFLLLIVFIRSLFSEPIIYKISIKITSEIILKILFFSIFLSIIFSFTFYIFTNNIFFIYLIIPSVINVLQDFTRYGLIAFELKQKLVVSDIFWFLSSTTVLISLYFFQINLGKFLYIFLWSFLGTFSFLNNFAYLKAATRKLDQKFQPAIDLLGFSLLIDKILPRLVGESQYFFINLFYPCLFE